MNRQSGFSLIEVLVAFAIISLIILTGFQVFGDGLRRIDSAEKSLRALNVARLYLDFGDTLSDLEGLPARQVGRQVETLTGEAVQWTEAVPELQRIELGGGETLETIVIRMPDKR